MTPRWSPPFPTLAHAVRAHAESDRALLRFESHTWTGREFAARTGAFAAFLAARLDPSRPRHVGVLLQNTPAFAFALSGAAHIGATVVGINPTRRGPELARDVAHTHCQIVITDEFHRPLVADADLDLPSDAVVVLDDVAAAIPDAPAPPPAADPADQFLLIFTSGTTKAPKAVRMTAGRLADHGAKVSMINELTADDVVYSSMPLFHSNALITAFMPAFVAGSTLVLKRRFSASEFVADVHHYGATYANYVGKALSYVLAVPEAADDANLPLRRLFGNEAAPIDAVRFGERFGCRVVDGYGSTEGGVAITKTPDTPAGALGRALVDRVAILDENGNECERARFDADGRLANSEAAIGEIVNIGGAGVFEGYYNDPESDADRMRDGKYWTGDLGYLDEDGFFYFAGRKGDWLRVDGENFAAAPVERILGRWTPVTVAVVYAVPDVVTGDQVMAAVELEDGPDAFDAAAFAAFLAAQPDLGTKMVPRYVRVSAQLPRTETQKVLTRHLRREGWESADPVWVRDDSGEFRRLATTDVADLRAQFAARGREELLDR